MTRTCSRSDISDFGIDPPKAPSCTTNMAVVQGCKLCLITTETEVEDDTKRGNSSDDPTCTDRCSAKGACDPPHGEGVDPFHVFDMLDDSDALRCMPQC